MEIIFFPILQGYTPEAMFRVAEDFFISLNMSAMPPDFWLKSIFLDPVDRSVICQPSAWDFCDGVDYRLVFYCLFTWLQ